MIAEPLPPYGITELREDLHHLLQPMIGFMRLDDRDNPDPRRARDIDRLYLALALVDVAAGKPPLDDVDVRMARTRHGTGFFKQETQDVRDVIQAAVSAAATSEPVAVMLKVGGKPWRCECTGNVLTQVGDTYTCNSCGTEYVGS